MLISYALDGGSHGHGMDELAQRSFGYETIPFESVCGKGAGRIGFDQVPIDKATDYAAEDAEVTLRLWQALKPRLLEERMLTVYETLERPLVAGDRRHGGLRHPGRRGAAAPALGRVRPAHGPARGGGLQARRPPLQPRLAQAAGRGAVRRELAPGPVRPAGRKTKTGAYATGADVLEELAAQGHALPRVILGWRQLQKLTRHLHRRAARAGRPRDAPGPHLASP